MSFLGKPEGVWRDFDADSDLIAVNPYQSAI